MTDDDLMRELAAEAEAESELPPPKDALEALQRLAAEVDQVTARMARGEQLMKELAARKNTILHREMPDIMDTKKVPEFVHEGRRYKAGAYCHASIPKEKNDEACAWLEREDVGAGDIVNNIIVVSLPKDSEKEAAEIEKYVRERWQMATVSRERSVPWARLTSWLKEYLGLRSEQHDLPEPPMELLGASVGRVVKISKAK